MLNILKNFVFFIGFWIQEEVQVETDYGSPNTLSRDNKKIESDDSAYDFYKQYVGVVKLDTTCESNITQHKISKLWVEV